MDSGKLREYQNKLEKERAELIEELLKEETPEDFGGDIDHFEEEANETEGFGYKLAEARTTKDRVNEIDMALNKIREGKYGICEKCGREIEIKVLDIAPESRLCQSCKKDN